MISKLVAFSGGCHSGKTTTLNALKRELESRGRKVVVLNELLRKVTDKPIDELRKDPVEYYKVQKHIISAKIQQEQHAHEALLRADLEGDVPVIFLADRALSDSLFYLEHYVETSSFDDEQLKDYMEFIKLVFNEAQNSFTKRYDYVFEFTPIPLENNEDDKYRPKRLSMSLGFEYRSIMRNNRYFNGIASRIDCMKPVSLLQADSTDIIPWMIDLCER